MKTNHFKERDKGKGMSVSEAIFLFGLSGNGSAFGTGDIWNGRMNYGTVFCLRGRRLHLPSSPAREHRQMNFVT